MIIPYGTELGATIPIDGIREDIKRYLVVADSNLNYEYLLDNLDLIILTGYNEYEKEIPSFTYPLMIEYRHTKYLVIDCRKYVSSISDQPLNVKDITRDNTSLKFLINTSIIIDYSDGNSGLFRDIVGNTGVAFSFFMSNVINNIILLNPLEKVKVELVAFYYYNLLNGVTDSETILTRINRIKLSIPLTYREANSILKDTFFDKDYDVTLRGLLSMLRDAVDDENKKKYISYEVFVNSLGGAWYGPGTNEALVIACECVPLWTSICYTLFKEVVYNKSRLGSLMLKNSRNINGVELVKKMDSYLKTKTSEF